MLNKLVKVWSKVRWSFPFTTWDQDTCQKQFWRHQLDCWVTFTYLELASDSVLSFSTSSYHQFPDAVGKWEISELDSPWPLLSSVNLPKGRWSQSTLENRVVKGSTWWQSCTFKGGDVPQWGFCTKMACVELPAARAAVAELSWPVLAMGGNYPRAPRDLQFPKPFSSEIARLLLIFVWSGSLYSSITTISLELAEA